MQIKSLQMCLQLCEASLWYKWCFELNANTQILSRYNIHHKCAVFFLLKYLNY